MSPFVFKWVHRFKEIYQIIYLNICYIFVVSWWEICSFFLLYIYYNFHPFFCTTLKKNLISFESIHNINERAKTHRQMCLSFNNKTCAICQYQQKITKKRERWINKMSIKPQTCESKMLRKIKIVEHITTFCIKEKNDHFKFI